MSDFNHTPIAGEPAGELQQERALVEAIIRSAPGVFYIVDDSRHVVRWNKMLESLSGYSGEEIGDMDCLDFVIPEDRPLLRQRLQEAMETGHASVEVTLLTKSGNRIPMFATGERAHYRGPSCVVGMAIDITSKQREQMESAKRAEAGRRLVTLDAVEKQVMQMVVEGVPNKAIAKRMGVSIRTIENRRQAVMRKTGAKSPIQLAAIAVLSGDSKFEAVVSD